MPFYTLEELKQGSQKGNPDVKVRSAVGEFMKCAVVTKPEGKGPALHEHPNEEQWTLILEGQMHFILGDEERIVGPGDLVHIPRYTMHRSRPVNGPATFFTVKSPAGNGAMDQDYNKSAGAEAAERSYPNKKD
jgi:mannose-6-phosphate isomerase-like protein (cupin superfamily)